MTTYVTKVTEPDLHIQSKRVPSAAGRECVGRGPMRRARAGQWDGAPRSRATRATAPQDTVLQRRPSFPGKGQRRWALPARDLTARRGHGSTALLAETRPRHRPRLRRVGFPFRESPLLRPTPRKAYRAPGTDASKQATKNLAHGLPCSRDTPPSYISTPARRGPPCMGWVQDGFPGASGPGTRDRPPVRPQ